MVTAGVYVAPAGISRTSGTEHTLSTLATSSVLKLLSVRRLCVVDVITLLCWLFGRRAEMQPDREPISWSIRKVWIWHASHTRITLLACLWVLHVSLLLYV